MKKLLYPLMFVFLAACTSAVTVPPSDPNYAELKVYELTGQYVTGRIAFNKYKMLPLCQNEVQASTMLCSNSVTVKHVQDADNEVFNALSVAQAAARGLVPTTPVEMAQKLRDANTAVGRFTAVTTPLPKEK